MNPPRWIWWLLGAILLVILLSLLGVSISFNSTGD